MPAVKITFADTNKHSLFDLLTGNDTTQTVSETWNAQMFLGTGFDVLYVTDSTNNAGGVLLGDGTITSAIFGEKLAPSGSSLKNGKYSFNGVWVQASAASDILRISWTVGPGAG